MKPKNALTIGEVAASFGWSTRFVESLVRSEKIPGLEINGQYYFRREDIIDWLGQKIQTLDAARLSELEAKLEQSPATPTSPGNLPQHISSLLTEEYISIDRPLSSKRTILEELVSLAERKGAVLDRNYLLGSLLEREALCSTALPGGIAICHPRRPLPTALTDTLLTFIRTSDPIAFGAEDGEPTQLFFLLAATDDRSHLYGLSRLARILRGGLIQQLKSGDVKKPDQIIQLLRQAEASLAEA